MEVEEKIKTPNGKVKQRMPEKIEKTKSKDKKKKKENKKKKK